MEAKSRGGKESWKQKVVEAESRGGKESWRQRVVGAGSDLCQDHAQIANFAPNRVNLQ